MVKSGIKLRGGDLVVNYTDEKITLTGDTKLVYEGVAESILNKRLSFAFRSGRHQNFKTGGKTAGLLIGMGWNFEEKCEDIKMNTRRFGYDLADCVDIILEKGVKFKHTEREIRA